jgi:7,8-dihydropterin-6-yl-methyl-4-(beta-D-ribofuranosyl)aminobenzene 5'-phosphate synthase
MLIREIEKISITILMDNSTDLLLKNSAHALRNPLIVNQRLNLPPLVAEHGFSALINIVNDDNSNSNSNRNDNINNRQNPTENIDGNTNYTYLFDTGVTEDGVIRNADLLSLDFGRIDGIILSHGHFDHSSGLVNILKKITSKRSSPIDIFLHPDAFLRRWLVLSDGKRARMPSLVEKQLEFLGGSVHKSDKATVLPSKENPFLLMTGQIPRKTRFEKGFPYQYAENSDNVDHDNDNTDEKNLNLIPDPLVKDDQSIVVNLRKKGLVVLTGCGHAGIINTLNYAKDLTGVDKIYAIIGGFHLPADGGIYEEAMNPTIKEIQNADPQYIIPCHCTGWKATNRIIDLMPDKFIPSAVGTTFTF